jgi:hypothetical protein
MRPAISRFLTGLARLVEDAAQAGDGVREEAGAVGAGVTAAVSQFGGFFVWYRGLAALAVPRASQLQLAQPSRRHR